MSSILKADRIQSTSNGFVLPPAGGVIQTQYTQISAGSSISSATNTDTEISVLAVNITPTSTNSIIKIEAMVNGEWSSQPATYNSTWFFYRNSTKLASPAAGSRKVGILMGTGLTYESSDSSSTPEQASYMYFDTPNTTSQVTYKVGFNHSQSSTISWHLNKCVTDSDNVNQERGMSVICVTEIAG